MTTESNMPAATGVAGDASELPSPSSLSSSFDDGPDQGSGETYLKVMDSVTRIALAGFGGALAGLSVSRRRGVGNLTSNLPASVARAAGPAGRGGRRCARGSNHNKVKSQQAQAQQQQQPSAPYVDQDLPSTWAMACLTFAGIVEFARLISPTKMIMDMAESVGASTSGSNNEGQQHEQQQASSDDATDAAIAFTKYIRAEEARTISDYILGGSVAGAIFKGSSIQTSAGERLARAASARSRSTPAATAAHAARTGFSAGLLPGAALGLVAGLLHVGVGNLENMLQDTRDDDDCENK